MDCFLILILCNVVEHIKLFGEEKEGTAKYLSLPFKEPIKS